MRIIWEDEMAKELRVCVQVMRRKLNKGEVPAAKKNGRNWFIGEDAWNAWLNSPRKEKRVINGRLREIHAS